MRRLALAFLALLITAACAQDLASSSHQVVLGAIYPLSGPQAPGGKSELAGVQAAIRPSGPDVRLQVIDATTPQSAAAAVETLVKRYHVPAILGTYGSTLSAAASARAEELKTVYWETGAVADPITAQRHYVFRTVATGGAPGGTAAAITLHPPPAAHHPRPPPGGGGRGHGGSRASVGGGAGQVPRGLTRGCAREGRLLWRIDGHPGGGGIRGRMDAVSRRAAEGARLCEPRNHPPGGAQRGRAGGRQHQRRGREVRGHRSARRGSEHARCRRG